MLQEPTVIPRHIGWIEVICCGIFSVKTEEQIRRARRAQIAGQRVCDTICTKNGSQVNISTVFSQRSVDNTDRILVGETNACEPRDRHCFRPAAVYRIGKPAARCYTITEFCRLWSGEWL